MRKVFLGTGRSSGLCKARRPRIYSPQDLTKRFVFRGGVLVTVKVKLRRVGGRPVRLSITLGIGQAHATFRPFTLPLESPIAICARLRSPSFHDLFATLIILSVDQELALTQERCQLNGRAFRKSTVQRCGHVLAISVSSDTPGPYNCILEAGVNGRKCPKSLCIYMQCAKLWFPNTTVAGDEIETIPTELGRFSSIWNRLSARWELGKFVLGEPQRFSVCFGYNFRQREAWSALHSGSRLSVQPVVNVCAPAHPSRPAKHQQQCSHRRMNVLIYSQIMSSIPRIASRSSQRMGGNTLFQPQG